MLVYAPNGTILLRVGYWEGEEEEEKDQRERRRKRRIGGSGERREEGEEEREEGPENGKTHYPVVPGESGIVYCSSGYARWRPVVDLIFCLFIRRESDRWEYCGDYKVFKISKFSNFNIFFLG
jgi:hypothetical protein